MVETHHHFSLTSIWESIFLEKLFPSKMQIQVDQTTNPRDHGIIPTDELFQASHLVRTAASWPGLVVSTEAKHPRKVAFPDEFVGCSRGGSGCALTRLPMRGGKGVHVVSGVSR